MKPFPGVPTLSRHRRAQGPTIALASSGKAQEVEDYRKLMRIEGLADVVVSSDDAERSKPFPDIVAAPRETLAPVRPEAALTVGDTPYEAETATRAGIRTNGVLRGGFPEASRDETGCVAPYRDPQDLPDGYRISPIAR